MIIKCLFKNWFNFRNVIHTLNKFDFEFRTVLSVAPPRANICSQLSASPEKYVGTCCSHIATSLSTSYTHGLQAYKSACTTAFLFFCSSQCTPMSYSFWPGHATKWYMDMLYSNDREVLHVLGTLASTVPSERRHFAGGSIPKLGSVTRGDRLGWLVRKLRLSWKCCIFFARSAEVVQDRRHVGFSFSKIRKNDVVDVIRSGNKFHIRQS